MTKDIIIAGAGIGGITAAIALRRAGADVRVFERAEVLGEVGAGLQMSPNAMKALGYLGLGEAVKAAGFEPEHAVVRHWASGRSKMKVPLRSVCDAAYGAPYVHIHRADLHEILTGEARRLGVEFCLGQDVQGYANGASGPALIANDSAHECDLVVGADGVRSRLTEQMNPESGLHFTGQVAWRGCVPASALPAGLIPKDATVWAGPGRHFVAYYVRGGDLVNFVAVEERDDWRNDGWTCEGDVVDLRAAFSGWDRRIGQLLQAVETPFVWALFGRPTLPRWSDGRVVLLGDACHPTLPFMAQGAAMAIEDSLVLADAMQGNPSIKMALAAYEAVRKPRTTWLQARAASNAGLFHQHGFAHGLVPRAKMSIAGLLPKRVGLLPFDKIYGFDVKNPSA